MLILFGGHPVNILLHRILRFFGGVLWAPSFASWGHAQASGAAGKEEKSISAREFIDVFTKPSAEELARKEQEEQKFEAAMQAEFGPLRAMASSFPLISISADPATRPVFVSINLRKQALLRNGQLTGGFRLKVEARPKDVLYFAFFTPDVRQPRWLAIYSSPRLPIPSELLWNVLRYSQAYGDGLADDSPMRKYAPAGTEAIYFQALTRSEALITNEELLFLFQFPEASTDYIITMTYAFSPWARAKGTTAQEEIQRVLGIPN